MKLYYDRKSKDPTYFVQQGVRNGKKTTTKNIARIGKYSELLKDHEDPLQFAIEEVARYNKEFEKGNIESYLYRLMFDQLETYRRDIVDAIRKSDKMIEPSDFSAFKAMYEQDADLISDLLSELVRSGKAKQKVVDVIVKKGD